MSNFWQSGLIKKLGEGELPTVQISVKIDQNSVIKLAGALVITAIIIVLTIQILKRV